MNCTVECNLFLKFGFLRSAHTKILTLPLKIRYSNFDEKKKKKQLIRITQMLKFLILIALYYYNANIIHR